MPTQIHTASTHWISLAHASWQDQLRSSFASVNDLENAGLLDQTEAEDLRSIGDRFKVRVTPYYASLISPSASCPIRIQAIPALLEQDPELPDWAQDLSQTVYGRKTPWTDDAIGDVAKLSAPRLTHRYGSRAILHLSSLCALYCRFCFRKSHLNDSERTLYEGTLNPALEYLRDHREIREIILTGGDPLSVNDAAIEALFERIAAIPHIRTVRIHSRMPVTLPNRLTAELCEILARDWGFQVVLVSHFNHPAELTATAELHVKRLLRRGIALYNQNVLLAGVNDCADTLAELFQTLYEWGVRPYYLHHPDWTPGTFGFRVSIESGKRIYRQLRGLISGPALPEYILDLPGGHGKTPVTELVKLNSFIDQEHGLSAVIYEATTPTTRSECQVSVKYLDLCRSEKQQNPEI